MTLLLLSAAAATLLLGAAALLSLITRRASLRHAAWTVALAASLVLPAWLNWKPATLPTVNPLPSAAAESLARTAGISITVTPAAPVNWLAGLYLLGVVAVLMRYAASLLQLRRIRRAAHLLEPGVYESPAVAIPLTYGLMHPVILVPENVATPLVLQHERAHIERGDLWASAVATLATALYWFHPLVWYAAARLRHEAEYAVDDRIVTSTPDAFAYAQELLTVARRATRTPVAAIAMATPSQLEGRLLAILDERRNRRPVTARAWGLLTLAVVGLSVPMGIYAQGSGLSGTVRDATGVVPGAEVLLLQSPADVKSRTVSGPDGAYSFPDVPAGDYTVEVRKPGFELQRVGGIRITEGRPSRLDYYLQIGRIQETVQVEAQGVPSAPPAAPTRIRVGGNVAAANIVHRVNPTYPSNMKAQGIEGTVFIRAVIGKEGSVITCDVLAAPHEELAEASRMAVSQWQYKPTLLNGNPIEVETRVTVNYTLRP